MKIAKRYSISGQVQGVSYRFFTVTCAEALGITGWVQNRADGTVEAFAEGTEEQLREFEFDLSRGPRFARVAGVESASADLENLGEFKIRR